MLADFVERGRRRELKLVEGSLGVWFSVAGDLLGLGATIFFFVVVRRLSSMQIETHRAWIEAGQPPQPRAGALQAATQARW